MRSKLKLLRLPRASIKIETRNRASGPRAAPDIALRPESYRRHYWRQSAGLAHICGSQSHWERLNWDATRFEIPHPHRGPRPAGRGLVIASRRAELAKHDIRRSTIRRLRDDMRRDTIRLPREPPSEVAEIVSSLRRLEPSARATRCALVFG